MKNTRVIASVVTACISISGGASWSITLPYPKPILVDHGLVLMLDDRGHPKYRPADGLDRLTKGGKGHRATESPNIFTQKPVMVHRAMIPNNATPQQGDTPSAPTGDPPDWLTLPPIATPEPPSDKPSPVSLPASLWMLLMVTLGLLWIRLRNYPYA